MYGGSMSTHQDEWLNSNLREGILLQTSNINRNKKTPNQRPIRTHCGHNCSRLACQTIFVRKCCFLFWCSQVFHDLTIVELASRTLPPLIRLVSPVVVVVPCCPSLLFVLFGVVCLVERIFIFIFAPTLTLAKLSTRLDSTQFDIHSFIHIHSFTPIHTHHISNITLTPPD